MLSIIEHNKNTISSSWEDVKARAITGELKVGDQIIVEFDEKPTLFDVIGFNADKPVEENPYAHGYITIQMHDLLEERPFDTKDDWGSNIWENSEIRKYLNSDAFKNRFADLTEHIVPVWKENNSGQPTKDTFFLLSKDELDPAKTPYPFYQNERNRVKFGPDDRTDWYWSRSAYRGTSHTTWCVGASGSVDYYSATNANRCAPACVLIF